MKMMDMRLPILATVAAVVVASFTTVQQSAAQTAPAKPAGAATGRITGRVLEGGRAPSAAANVIVLGTKQGSQTDENGNFTIPGVPVGTQQIQVQQIGFDKQVKPVQVNAGSTTTIEFTLGSSKVVKEIDVIEVRAEKRIDTKSSTSKQSISSEKLKELPVDNLSMAVATKAGVVASSDGLHFRGGRAGEVKFQFDGLEVSDPLFGGQANIANLAGAGEVLSRAEWTPSTATLSGVIAVSTREGPTSSAARFGGIPSCGDPTKTFDSSVATFG
jgi:hypothetical protein